MKQMFIVGHGGPEKLQLRESPDPSPASGEIRIRVKASGISASSGRNAKSRSKAQARAGRAIRFLGETETLQTKARKQFREVVLVNV